MALTAPRALQAGLLALWAHAAAGAYVTEGVCARAGAALLQRQRHSATSMDTAERGTCAALIHQNGFFTVGIQVGTPGQKFQVVADTGSSLLIVQDCVCQEMGYCNKRDHCFSGTNRSASFAVMLENGFQRGETITFGSGTITGILAREKVRVGELETDVKDGLLLMTSKVMDFGGPFEGILGLGIPNAEAFFEAEGAHLPSGLLEQAKVKRFAMCVNQDSDRGVLRLSQAEAPNTTKHASIGVRHWSVGFHGISVAGSEMVHLQFCNPEEMRTGQVTPCAAIPDSGTTLMSGPSAHVSALLESICDGWPRCARKHTAMVQAARAEHLGANSFNMGIWSKEEVLNALLSDCEAWMDEFGLDPDMPDLHFHVVGGNGTRETLVLPARHYVIEKDVAYEGIASGHQKMCMLGLDRYSIHTARNGPGWVLGTAFFYAFNVHFDLSSKPPSVAFQSMKQAPCGECDAKLGLMSTRAHSGAGAALRRPRKLSGPARKPSFELGPVL